jgi:hypothetical protein
MGFENVRFVNEVFSACCAVQAAKKAFTAEMIIAELNVPAASDRDARYWQDKNITAAMSILEATKFIRGSLKPKYTANLGLLIEVKHGTVTPLGNAAKRLPKFLRLLIFWTCLQRKKILAVLGSLALLRLIHNAYVGATLLPGFIEYMAVGIVAWISYIGIRKILA